jgi:hypothetical protein
MLISFSGKRRIRTVPFLIIIWSLARKQILSWWKRIGLICFLSLIPYAVLVYSANVRDVYINGKAIVRDKKLTQHDLSVLRKKLNSHMGEFSQKQKKMLN